MRSKGLVSISQTIRQTYRSYSEHPGWKALGIALWLTVIVGAYACAQRYWADYKALFPSVKWFKFLGPLTLNLSMFIVSNCLYGLVYRAGHPFFERFKDNDNQWPWIANPEEWRVKLRRSLLLTANNGFILTPIVLYLTIFASDSLEAKVEASELPSFLSYFCQIFFMALAEDFSFYWSHRLLHHPLIYRHIHKVHHDNFDSTAIAAISTHPVEFILGNVIPASLGGLLLGSHAHLLTFMVFQSLRSLETIDSHSGYDFPWAISHPFPFGCNSKYHNYHHLQNIGNYGSQFIFWDSIFGTNSEYFDYLAAREKESQGKKFK